MICFKLYPFLKWLISEVKDWLSEIYITLKNEVLIKLFLGFLDN